ncbi:hypothetical protein [Afipia sp. OHSU_I-C4]|nr:hypothetical protein [Afipia sp. OHSU_I-C4]WIG54015.1 MAG: hypothetical protein OJF48_004938 [Afipia sp.]
MPLKAKLDGREIVSILCSDGDWSEAQRASKGTENRLRMSCCDAPAYASHSPLDLRYFAHKSGYDRCSSSGESDEHESLKAAAARAVQSLVGWQADVEVSGDGWRADVLAIRGSIKIAIEVQLSAQAKRRTGARNDRFEASEVSAFWLKGPRNHFNDFGDGLQAPVHGTSIREQMASVGAAVRGLLGAVERQVGMANELARLIRTVPGWKYKIDLQGTIPACFELQHEGKRQQILLGELGPSLLPTIFVLLTENRSAQINLPAPSYSCASMLRIFAATKRRVSSSHPTTFPTRSRVSSVPSSKVARPGEARNTPRLCQEPSCITQKNVQTAKLVFSGLPISSSDILADRAHFPSKSCATSGAGMNRSFRQPKHYRGKSVFPWGH